MFLQGFRCPGPAWSYLGPTWPPRRLQEPLERVPRLPRRLQESLRRLQRPPRHPQEPPRCSQDTSPRSPKIENFIMLFNLLAFLGLLGGSSLNMAVKTPSVASKTPSRSPREPPRYPHVPPTKSLQAASKSWPPVASSFERGHAPRVVWRWFARVGRLRSNLSFGRIFEEGRFCFLF